MCVVLAHIKFQPSIFTVIIYKTAWYQMMPYNEMQIFTLYSLIPLQKTYIVLWLHVEMAPWLHAEKYSDTKFAGRTDKLLTAVIIIVIVVQRKEKI